MAHFFVSLMLFWLKALGLIVFIVLGFGLLLAIAAKFKTKARKGMLIIENVSKNYTQERVVLETSLLEKKALKQLKKQRKMQEKAHKQQTGKRLFILEFKGDMQAHQVQSLAESVTALLQVATEEDQVLLKLQSPGGVVHGYGLAAAQLTRIRNRGLKLTVAVDQVAASGGYLMACTGSEIIASPFAIIGSIGVIAQIPNFYRFLQEKGIDFEQITAGEYKRTVTLFGKNTDADREKLKEQLEAIHLQFKAFITEYRPTVELAKVATGEYWLAKEALSLNLVDRLEVSDDFILSAYQENYAIYQISYLHKKTFSGKIGEFFSAVLPKGIY